MFYITILQTIIVPYVISYYRSLCDKVVLMIDKLSNRSTQELEDETFQRYIKLEICFTMKHLQFCELKSAYTIYMNFMEFRSISNHNLYNFEPNQGQVNICTMLRPIRIILGKYQTVDRNGNIVVLQFWIDQMTMNFKKVWILLASSEMFLSSHQAIGQHETLDSAFLLFICVVQ
jgi:hypothetical protein